MVHRSEALDVLVKRVLTTAAAVGSAWPYHADPETGEWVTVDDGDWCAGHWIESLRIASQCTGRRDLLTDAQRRIEEIRPWLAKDDMFRAPMFYYSAARMAEAFNDKDYRDLALAAADAVRGMAMQVNGAMPIGSEVRVKSTDVGSSSVVAIDNVHPNLILDWYALRVTGDRRYEIGARKHLDFTARNFIREDGSTIEFIEFDPESGQQLREFTLLGISDDSCWARGQAWGVAGYLRAFEELGDLQYLQVAERLFDYWRRNCATDSLIPPWDFVDPDPDRSLDTSAAAIVAEQLARLSVREDRAPQAVKILQYLDPMLDELVGHVTPTTGRDDRPRGMLLDGCFNGPRRFADHHELIWGDFYLLSALHAINEGGLPC